MDGKAVPKRQYLTRRGSRFYLRRRVPDEIREAYGKTEIVESLGASDLRVAQLLLSKRLAELEEEFAEYAGRQIGSTGDIVNLSYAQIDRLVASWRQSAIADSREDVVASNENTLLTPSDVIRDRHDMLLELDALHHGGDDGALRRVEELADRLLVDNGFPRATPKTKIHRVSAPIAAVDKSSQQYEFLCRCPAPLLCTKI